MDPQADGAETTGTYTGWHDELTPFVEWSNASASPTGRRGWIVWRGEHDWPITPEMAERAWTHYGLGVSVRDNGGRPADLAALREHLPRLRSLHIDFGRNVRGYGELRRARMLEELVIESEPREESDLSRLWQLREYTGPLFGQWSTVLRLPHVETLNVLDLVTLPIAGPVQNLFLRSRETTALPQLDQPSKLRRLHVSRTRSFDLKSLAPTIGMSHLDVTTASFSGLQTLLDLPALTQITLEGGTKEDTSVLADLTAPEVILDLKPRASAELIQAAVKHDWVVNATARELRLAYTTAGRVDPDARERKYIWAVRAGDLSLRDDGRSSLATLTSEKDDLPDGLSGISAEALLKERIRTLHGSEVADAIKGDSTADRMIVTFEPWVVDRDDVAEVAAEVFDAHRGDRKTVRG